MEAAPPFLVIIAEQFLRALLQVAQRMKFLGPPAHSVPHIIGQSGKKLMSLRALSDQVIKVLIRFHRITPQIVSAMRRETIQKKDQIYFTVANVVGKRSLGRLSEGACRRIRGCLFHFPAKASWDFFLRFGSFFSCVCVSK